MFNNEVFLLKDNNIFVFDRRNKRLFRINSGERIEIEDCDTIGRIITSNASVLTAEQAGRFSVEAIREIQ